MFHSVMSWLEKKAQIVRADKFWIISHVSHIEGDTICVHFSTPQHALADRPPSMWPATRDWDLAQYWASSAATVSVQLSEGDPLVPMQVTQASRAANSPPVIQLVSATGHSATLPVSGYCCLRTFLSSAPARAQAMLQEERLRRQDCLEQQWQLTAPARCQWEEAAMCLAQAPPPAAPVGPELPSTVSNKAKITAYLPFVHVTDYSGLDASHSIVVDRQ
eukprot:1421811-Rhodomonas_salina.2